MPKFDTSAFRRCLLLPVILWLASQITGGDFCSAQQPPGAPVDQVEAAEVAEKDESPKRNDPGPPQPEFNLEANLLTFDKVWETVAETLWDQELLEQRWRPARDKYRVQVEQSNSQASVRKLIQAMIDELELSHFGIIQASSVDLIDASEHSGDASVGLEFRLTDDGIIVSKVHEQSSASEAGVKPGWILEKMGPIVSSELLEKLESATRGPVRKETLVGLTTKELSTGKVGAKKSFHFLDENDQTQCVDLQLNAADGQMAIFGQLPPIRVQTRVKTLPGGIGYYWFSAFLDPVRLMPEYRTIIRDPNHQQGMIIDLRGNVGGLGAMTMGMASEFSDEPASLGVMTMKGAELKFLVNEHPDPVTGPVAILVDECSISSAEIFAGGLQDLGRARVFGGRTAGLALPSIVIRLPNGDGFQYAMANYHSASGKTLELNGVIPDEVIPLNRALLISDPDPVLTRAIDWIEQQTR